MPQLFVRSRDPPVDMFQVPILGDSIEHRLRRIESPQCGQKAGGQVGHAAHLHFACRAVQKLLAGLRTRRWSTCPGYSYFAHSFMFRRSRCKTISRAMARSISPSTPATTIGGSQSGIELDCWLTMMTGW